MSDPAVDEPVTKKRRRFFERPPYQQSLILAPFVLGLLAAIVVPIELFAGSNPDVRSSTLKACSAVSPEELATAVAGSAVKDQGPLIVGTVTTRIPGGGRSSAGSSEVTENVHDLDTCSYQFTGGNLGGYGQVDVSVVPLSSANTDPEFLSAEKGTVLDGSTWAFTSDLGDRAAVGTAVDPDDLVKHGVVVVRGQWVVALTCGLSRTNAVAVARVIAASPALAKAPVPVERKTS